MTAYLKRLLNGTKSLYGDCGLNTRLQAARLPVEACALRDVQISNLHRPTRQGIFARYQPRQRTFPDSPFLRYNADNDCHN